MEDIQDCFTHISRLHVRFGLLARDLLGLGEAEAIRGGGATVSIPWGRLRRGGEKASSGDRCAPKPVSGALSEGKRESSSSASGVRGDMVVLRSHMSCSWAVWRSQYA